MLHKKIIMGLYCKVCQLGGLYSEKLWMRAWKCCQRKQTKGNIFKPKVQTSQLANNLFIFSWDKLALQVGLRNFVIELAYKPSKNHDLKISNEGTSEQSRHKWNKDVLRTDLFWTSLSVASTCSSLIKFSKIVFPLWNFIQSLRF